MKTEAVLVGSLLFALLAACAPESDTDSTQAHDERPNVLLIVADDMGYSDIGAFGGEILTPNLDALAAEGIRLTNFHVLPSCSPTRSVLLSGVDNHQAGLGTMGEFTTPEMEDYPGYAGYLNFKVAALPEVLQSNGYRTYMAGKWHLGFEEETSPYARGFEETFILVPGGGSHWSDRRPLSPPQPMIYRRNGQIVEDLPESFYSTTYYTDALLEWLQEDRNDGQPFFAYLSYTAPHDPLHAPAESIEKYRGAYSEGWDVLRQRRLQALKALGIIPDDAEAFPRLPTVEPWAEMSPDSRQEAARDMEVYAAMVDFMDGQIQRLFDYLKEIGEYDNTLIIFFSDNGANGAHPTAYPEWTEEWAASFDNSMENRGLPGSFIEMGPGWAQASMSPSRMFKGVTAEGGIRSPFIAKMLGAQANAGALNHSFFHVRDIMPTILDLAKIEPPTEIDGRDVRTLQGQSVLGLLDGSAEAAYAGADEVGYELFGLKAFIDGEWKILWMPPPFGSGNWELYNLSADPAKMNDLAADHPERLESMIEMWERYKEENTVLDLSSLDLSEAI
ncbi:MAG: arylsulfatase [Planctomycetota bacterium]|jgi:arylsulfatase